MASTQTNSAVHHKLHVKFPKKEPAIQPVEIHHKSVGMGRAENPRDARFLARHMLTNLSEISIAVVRVDDPHTGLQHIYVKARSAEIAEAIGCALFSNKKRHSLVPVDASGSKDLIKETLQALADRLQTA